MLNTVRLRLDPPQPPLKRGAKNDSISPFLRGTKGDQLRAVHLNRKVLTYCLLSIDNK